MIVVTVVVVGLLVADLLVTKPVMDHRLGFSLAADTPSPLQVVEVLPGSPAQSGDLKVGDRIVGVNGKPITDVDGFVAAASRFQRGERVTLTVVRNGQRVELETKPGMPLFDWPTIISILTILAYLGLGLAALTYAGTDGRANLLCAFSLAVALEAAMPGSLVGVVWAAIPASIAVFLLNGFQIGIELHLASVIPRPRPWLEKNPWVAPLMYFGGILLALVPTSATLAAVYGIQDFPIPVPGAEMFFEDIVFVLWAIAVTTILFGGVRIARSARERSQALLVLFGVLPWAVYVFVATGWSWVAGDIPRWLIIVQPLILLVYPVAVLAAIFRYRLFDIEVVVRRGILYGTLTGLMLLIFYAAIGLGGALVSRLLGEVSSIWVFSGATLVLGLLASPLHRWLQQEIDRRIFPERQELRQRLVHLASELPAQGNLLAMGRHLVNELRSAFQAEYVALLLADPASGILAELAAAGPSTEHHADAMLLAPTDPGVEALSAAARPVPMAQISRLNSGLAQRVALHEASLAVPLLSGEYLVGIMLMGSREGAKSYGSEEQQLLSLLARNAATVFENIRLFQSATYEGLTGLYRREAILDRLNQELERALRYRRPLAVGMADLDHFKAVNDSYGHLVGDALLKRVAEETKATLRTSDAVGRYGGEEFLLVLPETELDGARAVAEKVRSRIEALRIQTASGATVGVTISIGLGVFDPNTPPVLTAKKLIGEADRQLLRAKEMGRNKVLPGG